ncbi:MBL fold metallo-hydrolase [Candidatus Nomurabacteria bacterium]|nr:MBL fold metallo-hydrolase [Candidatus Nomurabacteria bacterium]
MIITFHTQHFFKLQAGDTVIALNPVNANTSTKVNKFGSNIALSTYFAGDMQIFDTATYGDNEPVAIYGPGSYEVDGIQIQGFDTLFEGEHHAVYSFMFDSMRIGVLGDVSDKSTLSPDALEALNDADIIFAPATETAFEMATAFSPHIIIPTGYEDIKEIKPFLDTLSSGQTQKLDKLTIKQKDIESLQSFVYVFTA